MTDTQTLEEKIAHLTRMVEDLSDVVAGHSRTIDLLSRRVLALVEREAEREVASGSEIPIADQRPPHW
ncbi:MAG: SlyX family protein [Paracoccaceae bacterium]